MKYFINYFISDIEHFVLNAGLAFQVKAILLQGTEEIMKMNRKKNTGNYGSRSQPFLRNGGNQLYFNCASCSGRIILQGPTSFYCNC